MQKLSFFLVTALTAILLYYGLGTYSVVTEEEPDQSLAATLNYDGYSEGINTVLFDEDGVISYTLQAERQYHFKDSSSDLDQPFIRLFRDGETHWNIVADSGKIAATEELQNSEIGTIELSGEVEVYSFDEYGNRTVLTTEYLAIDTTAETMETDRPVKMVTTNIEQNAIGLFADLNRDELLFIEDSIGRYEYTTEM